MEGTVDYQGHIVAEEWRYDKALFPHILDTTYKCNSKVLLMVCVALGEDVPALVAHKDVVGAPLVDVGEAQLEIPAEVYQPAVFYFGQILYIEGEERKGRACS